MPADPVQDFTEELPDLFVCQKCGQCCRGYGGTVVNDADIAAIAAYIGISPEWMVQRHCQRSGRKTVLAQGPNGYCVFWDTLCTIHPVKPRMCREWPFIEAVVTEPANWWIMAGACPGMRQDVDPEQVRAEVARLIAKRKPPVSKTSGWPR